MRVIFCFITIFCSLDIFAIGLSNIDVYSYINEPLEAEIQVTELGSLYYKNLTVSLASSEEFVRANIERQSYLSTLSFDVFELDDNRVFIYIKSDHNLQNPYLELLLKLQWPGGSIVKNYTLLIDPYISKKTKRAIPLSRELYNYNELYKTQKMIKEKEIVQDKLPSAEFLPETSETQINLNDTVLQEAEKNFITNKKLTLDDSVFNIEKEKPVTRTNTWLGIDVAELITDEANKNSVQNSVSSDQLLPNNFVEKKQDPSTDLHILDQILNDLETEKNTQTNLGSVQQPVITIDNQNLSNQKIDENLSKTIDTQLPKKDDIVKQSDLDVKIASDPYNLIYIASIAAVVALLCMMLIYKRRQKISKKYLAAFDSDNNSSNHDEKKNTENKNEKHIAVSNKDNINTEHDKNLNQDDEEIDDWNLDSNMLPSVASNINRDEIDADIAKFKQQLDNISDSELNHIGNTIEKSANYNSTLNTKIEPADDPKVATKSFMAEVDQVEPKIELYSEPEITKPLIANINGNDDKIDHATEAPKTENNKTEQPQVITTHKNDVLEFSLDADKNLDQAIELPTAKAVNQQQPIISDGTSNDTLDFKLDAEAKIDAGSVVEHHKKETEDNLDTIEFTMQSDDVAITAPEKIEATVENNNPTNNLAPHTNPENIYTLDEDLDMDYDNMLKELEEVESYDGADGSAASIKLGLARQYMSVNDFAGAKEVLEEILTTGNETEKGLAKQLLDDLPKE